MCSAAWSIAFSSFVPFWNVQCGGGLYRIAEAPTQGGGSGTSNVAMWGPTRDGRRRSHGTRRALGHHPVLPARTREAIAACTRHAASTAGQTHAWDGGIPRGRLGYDCESASSKVDLLHDVIKQGQYQKWCFDQKNKGPKDAVKWRVHKPICWVFFQFIRCKTVQSTSEAKWSFALDITLKIDPSVKLETNFKFSVK